MSISGFLLIMSVCAVSATSPDKELRLKEQELTVLKGYLEAARDSLQNEIASRWRLRQVYFEQRESDKERLEQYRDAQERIHNELSRLKEECYSKDRTVESELKIIDQKKSDWEFLHTSVDETFKKESEQIAESFPYDIEKRQNDLEIIRRKFKSTANITNALGDLADYRLSYIKTAGKPVICKSSILPDKGDPVEVTSARFGNVFSYAVTPQSEMYMIRQSGNLGANRYTTEQIGESPLKIFLNTVFPGWIEKNRISGSLMFDIMQNSQASILIKGQKISSTDRIKTFIKAGGPVMFPLFLLVFWALILLVVKLFQFSSKHTADSKISQTVLSHLLNNDIAKAEQYINKRRGVVARVVKTCLEHSKWTRISAEKAVKEILLEEVPLLNKHLNTLAVIAGAAPLLGLLGTVTGMINLFEVITNYGTGDPKILAGGISEALVTTEVGLIIAIPVLLIHNFLRNRSNDIQAETEKHAVRILNRLWPES